MGNGKIDFITSLSRRLDPLEMARDGNISSGNNSQSPWLKVSLIITTSFFSLFPSFSFFSVLTIVPDSRERIIIGPPSIHSRKRKEKQNKKMFLAVFFVVVVGRKWK
jgi:hypothetical protein